MSSYILPQDSGEVDDGARLLHPPANSYRHTQQLVSFLEWLSQQELVVSNEAISFHACCTCHCLYICLAVCLAISLSALVSQVDIWQDNEEINKIMGEIAHMMVEQGERIGEYRYLTFSLTYFQ